MTEKEMEEMAERSARLALKKTFAIFGVNIDNPSEVEEFRKDLRFAGFMRQAANKGVMTFVVVLVGGIMAALWAGIRINFKA